MVSAGPLDYGGAATMVTFEIERISPPAARLLKRGYDGRMKEPVSVPLRSDFVSFVLLRGKSRGSRCARLRTTVNCTGSLVFEISLILVFLFRIFPISFRSFE